MIHSRYLAVAFGSLVATAALIPTKAFQVCLTRSLCIRANLIGILQEPAIADVSPVKTVRRSSMDDEETALEILAGNTFMVTAVVPLKAQERFSEYPLLQKLSECIATKGSDPTPINGQSMIGDTPLEEVRFSQCNIALSDCAKTAMVEADARLLGWPAPDKNERPVLRTHSLNLCTGICRRSNALDNRVVFENVGMTREQLRTLGTVAYCNVPLIECLEDCVAKYDAITTAWDVKNPEL